MFRPSLAISITPTSYKRFLVLVLIVTSMAVRSGRSTVELYALQECAFEQKPFRHEQGTISGVAAVYRRGEFLAAVDFISPVRVGQGPAVTVKEHNPKTTIP